MFDLRGRGTEHISGKRISKGGLGVEIVFAIFFRGRVGKVQNWVAAAPSPRQVVPAIGLRLILAHLAVTLAESGFVEAAD